METPAGVLAPDVAWMPSGRWAEVKREDTTAPTPEICVEILSPSDTDEGMAGKRRAYFEAGTEEVWIVSESGTVRFFTGDEEMEASSLAPSFPSSL